MSHISVYRRWRPQTFDEIIGQQRITRTLQNAIRAGRITHAYLFAGWRGTGKTTVARILAKALNCVHGPTPEPCNACPACQAVTRGNSLDVIEIDGASHTQVDHIRDLKEKIILVPAEGRYKIYIIDEVHMLSTSAFNALLKTLEEPPPHAVFVLVTTEPHKIPATVASRCQRFDFRRVPLAEITSRLSRIAAAEGFVIDDRALRHIARLADGSVRDAESVLDQVSAYKDEGITTEDILTILGAPADETLFALVDALLRRDPVAVLRIASALIDEGKESRQVMRTLLEYFRDLLIAKVAQQPEEVLDTTPERLEALQRQAAAADLTDVLRAVKILSDADVEARAHSQPRLLLEISLIRLARPEMDPTIEGLQARVAALEGGGKPASRRATASSSSEPTEEPATVASTQEDLTGLTLQDIRNRWARVLEEVKRLRMFCHALLIEGIPLEVQGKTLVVGLRAGYNFHRDSLHRPENREIVEQALERVFGRRMVLQCRLQEELAEPPLHPEAPPHPEGPPLHDPAPPPPGADDPLVTRAVELFGGEVVEVRRVTDTA